MTHPLTATERRVYDYLLDFTAENTFQPSIREIGKRFRIKSTKTVSDILQALAAKGYIERDASRSRGVRLLGFSTAARTQPVPYYGRVHAGEPALVSENRSGYFTIDRRFVPNERAFFLRVEGDSMTDAGILEHDYVMIDPDGEVRNGDMIAGRIGEGAVVKRLERDGDEIVLRSESEDGRDLRVKPGDDFVILGKLCGVFRPLVDSGGTQSTDVELADEPHRNPPLALMGEGDGAAA